MSRAGRAVVLMLVSSIFLESCVTAMIDEDKRRLDESMKHWVGKTEHELILAWGPPEARDSDGAGGQVLVWVIREKDWVPLSKRKGVFKTDDNGNVTYTPPEEPGITVKTRMFYVNGSGVIYAYRWRGL